MSILHSAYYRLLSLTFTLFLFAACKHERVPRSIERSFYYWKSSFVLNGYEKNVLEQLHVTTLYIKFFDVSWNRQTNKAMPLAIIKFPAPVYLSRFSIVPTVFITNECVHKMDTAEIKVTADRVIYLIKRIASANAINAVPEIQIDCDWTEGTKIKYFALLQAIRQTTSAENKKLSATIRLYQCRYSKAVGVPPVDRGLLMCYNMGNLKDPSTGNSILQLEELKRYTEALPGYPLPLDVALPLFQWKVLFRNNRYRGLIRELPESYLASKNAVRSAGPFHTVLLDTLVDGYDLKAGDLLRDEQVKFDDLIRSANVLGEKLKTQKLTVSLYHLDSLTLSKYSLHELETVFDHLH